MHHRYQHGERARKRERERERERKRERASESACRPPRSKGSTLPRAECVHYRVTSLIRKHLPLKPKAGPRLGPYSAPKGGGGLLREVPLYGSKKIWPPCIFSREGRARRGSREIGILLTTNRRQHRTLHIQENVQPYALCELLCPVSAASVGIFRMDSISTSYHREPYYIYNHGGTSLQNQAYALGGERVVCDPLQVLGSTCGLQ